MIASITKEVICDGVVYGNKSVTILEIMGRNTGRLTGSVAFSKGEDCEGPDMIYLPELPFDIDAFMTKVEDMLEEAELTPMMVDGLPRHLRLGERR